MTQEGLADFTARFAHLPSSVLHAELQRRQTAGDRPACGSDKDDREYSLALHLAALFQILLLSTLACSFPLIVRRFPKLPVPNHALFISRHLGTGVLIATAFVHLFPTAYTNLLDPCLPPFWTHVYPAMPGFIAMLSVMAVVGIEMFFATKGAAHSHHVDLDQLRSSELHGLDPRPAVGRRSQSFNRFQQLPLAGPGHDGRVAVAEQPSLYMDTPLTPTSSSGSPGLNKPLPRTPSPGWDAEEDADADADLALDELDPAAEDTQPLTRGADRDAERLPLDAHSNGHVRIKYNRNVSWADHDRAHADAPPPPTPHEQRLVLQCLMLEAGILFHSVFIGLALSVSTGSKFVVLLVAVSFHQTFEGLALGSRIASISSFSTTSYKPWLMGLMYGITTPIGQAIGLGVQGLYDPHSQFGLLTVGIVNAISSGLLLYAGLVQLLAEDFLSEASYVELRGRRRLQACAGVVAGAMLMALVGVWA